VEPATTNVRKETVVKDMRDIRVMEEGLYRNGIEAYLWHQNTTDDLAYRTISAISDAYLYTEARTLQPEAPVDYLFLDVMAVKSLSAYFGHTPLYPLPVCEPTCGVNYPDINDERWRDSEFVQSGVARVFLETIRRESVKDGGPFDVGYAFARLYYAFDHYKPEGITGNILAWIEEGRGRTCMSRREIEEDFDLWCGLWTKPGS
jgi:hypothetical protein